MTPALDIAAVRARAEAATGGALEWESGRHEGTVSRLISRRTVTPPALYKRHKPEPHEQIEAVVDIAMDGCQIPHIVVSDEDAALFAHARADILAACNELESLRARVAELEATLANERGEGEPPSVGWAWTGRAWVRDGAAKVYRCTYADPACPAHWRAETMEDDSGDDQPTAREAMRAANEALNPRSHE